MAARGLDKLSMFMTVMHEKEPKSKTRLPDPVVSGWDLRINSVASYTPSNPIVHREVEERPMRFILGFPLS